MLLSIHWGSGFGMAEDDMATNGETKQRTFRMDDALFEGVRRRAHARGLTVSAYLRMVLQCVIRGDGVAGERGLSASSRRVERDPTEDEGQ